MLFSLISRNVAGQTKKSTTLAISFIAWAGGNAAAPQIFQNNDKPRYHKALTTHLCLYVLYNIFLLVIRFIYVQRNKAKRVAAMSALAVEPSGNLLEADQKISHAFAFEDLTDRENPDFRVSRSVIIRFLVVMADVWMNSMLSRMLSFIMGVD
jgi:3-methyladenine DNA glycosylase/8-oxoguanine DNA glycosylase